MVPSWLPHTETQGNTINTDINVDAMYQKRLFTILWDNPFGALFDPSVDGFEHLYNDICNITKSSSLAIKRRRSSQELTELHKVSIALQMRGTTSSFSFKYRPQHVIHGELCMVLQERVFRFDDENNVLSKEITRDDIGNDDEANSVVVVREVAFGPDCDPSVRGVSLFFNIPDDAVVQCTPQQAKRFRWRKGKKNKNKSKNKDESSSSMDRLESFLMVRTCDPDSFSFTTAVLEHRLAVLKARDGEKRLRSLLARELNKEKKILQTRFSALNVDWETWAWPSHNGNGDILDEDTPVPKVDMEYSAPLSTDGPVAAIWDDFTSFMESSPQRNGSDGTAAAAVVREKKRLSVFPDLTEERSLTTTSLPDGCSLLPHITKRQHITADSKKHSESVTNCWKSLLLVQNDDDDEESDQEQDVWSIVQDHFKKARTVKTLSIVQGDDKAAGSVIEQS